MLQVPGWVVVLIMVSHAVLTFVTTQSGVAFDPLVNLVLGAALIGLNVLQSLTKSIVAAVRTLGSKW